MFSLIAVALAESWCADPLYAHEWGVTLLTGTHTSETVPLPPWFERTSAKVGGVPAVWDLPRDHGERELPLLQFFGAAAFDEVHVALEVGFRDGGATAWFPPVSAFTDAETAHSPGAHRVRQGQLAARLQPKRPSRLIDPTYQLHWESLTLRRKGGSMQATHIDWVKRARQVEALHIDLGQDRSERFVFYEGKTRETSDLVVSSGSDGGFHRVLRNVGPFDVHDVVLIENGRMWWTPKIPAGKSAGFVLERPHDAQELKRWLGARWVDTVGVPPSDWTAECIMMRDPAVPAPPTKDHRLFAAELELLWSVWEQRLLEAPVSGSRILYREDPAALDARVPLALFTDRYADPRLSRLGVVLVAP